MVIQVEFKFGIFGKEYWSGIWFFFWMFGKFYCGVGDSVWLVCGEIDIFENVFGENFIIFVVYIMGFMIGEIGYYVEFNCGMYVCYYVEMWYWLKKDLYQMSGIFGLFVLIVRVLMVIGVRR